MERLQLGVNANLLRLKLFRAYPKTDSRINLNNFVKIIIPIARINKTRRDSTVFHNEDKVFGYVLAKRVGRLQSNV